jgi:GTPase SAR1 family protein
MKTWLSEMRSIMTNDVPKVIIGNKSDLIPEIGQIVDRNVAENYAKNEGCFYIETSAKTGDNVEKAFLELTQLMVKL